MTNNLININYVFIEYTYIIAKSACIQFFKSAIFLSMSWKILENFLPYKRENIAFAFILYVSQAEIWNVKCRIHLSCCVCRGMNLYKEPGNKKSGCFFSAWCYIWCLCCYMIWGNCRNESALSTILFLVLKSCLPPLLAEAKTLCGLKKIWIQLVSYKGKLILTYKDHTVSVSYVCSHAHTVCWVLKWNMTLKTACLSCHCLLMLCTYPYHYKFQAYIGTYIQEISNTKSSVHFEFGLYCRWWQKV